MKRVKPQLEVLPPAASGREGEEMEIQPKWRLLLIAFIFYVFRV